MTCLDRSLEAVLTKDLAEAIEAEDQQKIRIAELSLDTFKRYCNDVESEFIQVPERMDELVQTHVEHLADVIWTRLWQPQFIDYVLDPHGYARGYFSEPAWQTLSADILETYDAQWFFDQEAMLSVALLDQDVAELEDHTWEVKVTLAVRLYLGKSDERLELKHDERYLIGANAKYVSDTNFAGLYLIETDADIAPVFETIYETFPVQKGKGDQVKDTPAD
ncbi:MAG: hypothetical protein AXW12_19475 [Thalassospira sp. Nap_22]|nr:MAG: hypothetical protein AXW12_19475 [Thalassospira sp. Nap_22]